MIKQLSEAFGVSGTERAVRDIILKEISGFCDNVSIDSIGNLIAYKKGKTGNKSVLLTANTDECGFIITQITKDGFLKFDAVGVVDPATVLSKAVCINGKVNGVISAKAVHMLTKEEREKPVSLKNLFIDIGADSYETARKVITEGDYAAFLSNFISLGGNYITGKALPRSAGCSALINVLRNEYDCDIYCVFAAQNEIGGRGIKIASNSIKTDYAISIGAEFCRMTENDRKYSRIGNGVILPIKSGKYIARTAMVERFKTIAKEENLSFSILGSSQTADIAASVLSEDANVNALSLLIPCKYMNSPAPIMNEKDIESAEKIICKFLEGLK